MEINNKNLFNADIDGVDSWREIYQSIELWEPLINYILKKENLPLCKIENLFPGTNAVYKSGKYVVKIFAPKESGFDGAKDYKTEMFALSFAQSNGVPVSKLIANGEVSDKYYFPYMILEYIDGFDLFKVSEKFNESEKFEFGKRLREITDLMNKPCEPFNDRNAIFDDNKRWDKFSENFKRERFEYLNSHDFGEKVFVHGDLGSDNIMVDKNGGIYIIDFADSILAPICYEHAYLIMCGLFEFDKSYLRGYFGEYNPDELFDICFDGVLIHDFGSYLIECIAEVEEINCLADLRERIKSKLI